MASMGKSRRLRNR